MVHKPEDSTSLNGSNGKTHSGQTDEKYFRTALMHHRLKKVIGVTLVHFAKNCKATTCPSLLQLWIENMPLKDPEGDLFKAVCNYCRQLLDLRQSKRLVANY